MAVGPTMRRIFRIVYDATAGALKSLLVDSAGTEVLGKVTVSPVSYTVLDRLKTVATNITNLATTVVLAAGSAVIGKVRLVTATGSEVTDDTADAIKALLVAGTNLIGKVGIDQTTPGTTNLVATSAVKTIQTELLAITAVGASAQQKSSELALTGIKKAAVFIDHARDATTALVVAGTEYRVEVSEKASGADAWRTIASATCGIVVALDIVMDNEEPAGEIVIHCSAVVPTKGDIVFFKNATIANSEWAKVVAVDATGGSESFTIQDGLTNIQAALAHMYNKAEQFVLNLDVEPYTRMRVVINNNNGTTNAAIVSRIACITEK